MMICCFFCHHVPAARPCFDVDSCGTAIGGGNAKALHAASTAVKTGLNVLKRAVRYDTTSPCLYQQRCTTVSL